jgi:hypothetical protein
MIARFENEGKVGCHTDAVEKHFVGGLYPAMGSTCRAMTITGAKSPIGFKRLSGAEAPLFHGDLYVRATVMQNVRARVT